MQKAAIVEYYVSEQESYNIPDGTIVLADYCGNEVKGKVLSSRAKYGLSKRYVLELDEGFRTSYTTREKGEWIVVDNHKILHICR
jgi:hypothetical protein